MTNFTTIGVVTGVLVLLLLIFILPGLFLISANQVGILTKKMTGAKLTEGQVVARKGENGIQANVLMPGLFWKLWIIWSWNRVPVTVIGPGKIGIIESIDGIPLPPHRILGDEIDCNSYQDAKKFLDNGGHRGVQIGFLRPGTYRINTKVFNIKEHTATVIDKNKIGVVIATDGVTLPNGYIIAPEPTGEKVQDHKHFQDGQSFINSGGYRGPQLDTLQPGQYYINPALFQVSVYDLAEVPPGYVAILRSNVGKELVRDSTKPSDTDKGDKLTQPVHSDIETLLIQNKDQRGIWREPVAPGKYNLNPIAFTVYLVPTSAVTIDWASGTESRSEVIGAKPKSQSIDTRPESEKATEFFKFSQLRVTSKDGFQLEVDVRMVIRIKPDNAAFIIARFGTVTNLIEQIVHPLIDSSFRNKAGEEKAIAFIQGRTELQKEALERARVEFDKYYVEAQNLLIAYIDVDKELLGTQTKKEIALQQQAQYEQEAKAQEVNIIVQEKSARASKQKDVIAATLQISINRDMAEAAVAQAEGVKRSTILEADGYAYKSRTEGEGIAAAYTAQTKALGPDAVYLLKFIDSISTGKVKIVPDIVAGGDSGLGLINAFLAKRMLDKPTPPATPEAKAPETIG